MSNVMPRHVLCVLGPDGWSTRAKSLVEDIGSGFELDMNYSLDMPDARMPAAFMTSCDRVSPSFKDSDLLSVDSHGSVLYILSPQMGMSDSVDISRLTLRLVSHLFEGGALAVKNESSGIAHGRERWLDLSILAHNTSSATKALYDAFVRRPISDRNEVYTCGMHLLGQPDIVCRDRSEIMKMVDRIDRTADMILSARASASAFPCMRYEEDDFFYNPYGYVEAFASPSSDTEKRANSLLRFFFRGRGAGA